MTTEKAGTSADKSCMVTGCAGFVGSHLCEALLARGFGVVGVDNLTTGKTENMRDFLDNPNFSFYRRDIKERGLVTSLRQKHPALRNLFHLAAIVSVAYSVEHPLETMETNYTSSIALYEEASLLEFRSFVYAGSAAEYGNLEKLPLEEQDVSIKENHAGLENLQASPYGQAKYLTSRYIETCEFGSSLRFFNIYGPRQDASSPYSGVISRFVAQALNHECLTVLGSGDQSRDFIYISDAVEAYLAAAGLRNPGDTPLKGIFNVGTQKSTSITDLAALIEKVSGSKAGMCYLPPRKGDIKHSLADVEKLQRLSGFHPRVGLEEGLGSLIAWERLSRERETETGMVG